MVRTFEMAKERGANVGAGAIVTAAHSHCRNVRNPTPDQPWQSDCEGSGVCNRLMSEMHAS
jgi:hypothetical protein